MRAMKIVVTAERRIPKSPTDVFRAATALANLPRMFPGFGVVPGVLEATVDGPVQAGALRKVKTKDGGAVEERIVEHEEPRSHKYILEGIRPPFSWIVKKGESAWQFQEHEGETLVVWSADFTLTTPLVAPIARFLLSHFRRSMDLGLENLASLPGI